MLIKEVCKSVIKLFKTTVIILIFPIILSSCKTPDGKFKLPGATGCQALKSMRQSGPEVFRIAIVA